MLEFWNRLFFSPEDPSTLAIFRILFGAVLTYDAFHLLRIGWELYGDDQSYPMAALKSEHQPLRLSWFFWLGHSRRLVQGILWFEALCCMSLTFGFYTRLSAAFLCVCILSRRNRNRATRIAVEQVWLNMLLLVAVSNAGAALSLDSYFAPGTAGIVTPQWALVLMRVQLSAIYFYSVTGKLRLPQWRDGTMIFHVLHNFHCRTNVKMPRIVAYRPVSALMSWGSLLVQTSMFTIIWVPELRYAAILAAISMHIGMQVYLSISKFQPIMICCALLFIPGSDMAHWLSYLGWR